MAITGSFSYTNNADVSAAAAVTPKAVKPVANYALIEDEPTRVVMQNTTGTIDQTERIIFQKSDLKNVAMSEATPYPDVKSKCVQYGVKLEQYLRLSSSTEDTFVQDEPITCTITFKHPQVSYVNSDTVYDCLCRALGALSGDTPSATSMKSRINELMRGSLKPQE